MFDGNSYSYSLIAEIILSLVDKTINPRIGYLTRQLKGEILDLIIMANLLHSFKEES